MEISLHAKEQALIRGISLEIIVEVFHNPDSILEEDEGQKVYQKLVMFYEEKFLFVFL